MPIMVADWQKKATSAKLKKFNSTFQNVFRRTVVDNGDFYAWEFVDQKQFANDYILPYLNIGQMCEYGKEDACDYEYTRKFNGGSYKQTINFHFWSDYVAFALADGSTVRLYKTKDSYKDYIQIVFDTNGPKKPNIEGKDVFEFHIYHDDNGYLYFNRGTNIAGNAKQTREALKSACKQTSSGYCANLVMADGWELRDDYPW